MYTMWLQVNAEGWINFIPDWFHVECLKKEKVNCVIDFVFHMGIIKIYNLFTGSCIILYKIRICLIEYN